MDLRHINFRLLEVFLQVVEHQSISAAARNLYLTQPTVSAQIRRLEAIFQTKLLLQSGRKMLPTPAGVELYQAAGDSIRRLGDCAEKLSAIRQGLSGKLQIALVNTAQYVVPQLVAAFNKEFPEVQVELRIGNRNTTLQRYFQNKDDIYLFSHPPTDEQAMSVAFMKNPLVLISPPGHWAIEHKALEFHQLLHERFLIREAGSATRMVFDSWLASHGYQLSQRTQIESNEAIRLSVAAGSGLAVISKHIVEHGSDLVRTLNVKGFPLPSQWHIVHRRDNRQQSLIARFRETAIKHQQ